MGASGNRVYVAGGWTSGCCRAADNNQVEVAAVNGINSLATTSDIRVDANSTTGTMLDYGLVYLHQGTTVMRWRACVGISRRRRMSAVRRES